MFCAHSTLTRLLDANLVCVEDWITCYKYKQLHYYMRLLIISNLILKVVFVVLEVDMKREMERKELERKKSPKMEFVSGGTQPGGTVVTAPKINIPFSGLYQSCSSLFLIVIFFL